MNESLKLCFYGFSTWQREIFPDPSVRFFVSSRYDLRQHETLKFVEKTPLTFRSTYRSHILVIENNNKYLLAFKLTVFAIKITTGSSVSRLTRGPPFRSISVGTKHNSVYFRSSLHEQYCPKGLKLAKTRLLDSKEISKQSHTRVSPNRLVRMAGLPRPPAGEIRRSCRILAYPWLVYEAFCLRKTRLATQEINYTAALVVREDKNITVRQRWNRQNTVTPTRRGSHDANCVGRFFSSAPFPETRRIYTVLENSSRKLRT